MLQHISAIQKAIVYADCLSLTFDTSKATLYENEKNKPLI